MTWLVQYHGGPDRDALVPFNQPPPEHIYGELVTDRTYVEGEWQETKKGYRYDRANVGGEHGVTHYVFACWLSLVSL